MMTSLSCDWPELLTVFLNTPQIELNNKEPSQLLLDTGSTLAYQNLPYYNQNPVQFSPRHSRRKPTLIWRLDPKRQSDACRI